MTITIVVPTIFLICCLGLLFGFYRYRQIQMKKDRKESPFAEWIAVYNGKRVNLNRKRSLGRENELTVATSKEEEHTNKFERKNVPSTAKINFNAKQHRSPETSVLLSSHNKNRTKSSMLLNKRLTKAAREQSSPQTSLLVLGDTDKSLTPCGDIKITVENGEEDSRAMIESHASLSNQPPHHMLSDITSNNFTNDDYLNTVNVGDIYGGSNEVATIRHFFSNPLHESKGSVRLTQPNNSVLPSSSSRNSTKHTPHTFVRASKTLRRFGP